MQTAGTPPPDFNPTPRNHTRSWPMAQLGDACEHVIGTLQAVYGFTEHDAIAVYLDPFT